MPIPRCTCQVYDTAHAQLESTTSETGGPLNPVSPARRPPSLSPAAAHKPSLRHISAACKGPQNVGPVGLGPAPHSDTKVGLTYVMYLPFRARAQLSCCCVRRLTPPLPSFSVLKDVVTIMAALVLGAPTLLAALASAAKTVKILGYIAFHAP